MGRRPHSAWPRSGTAGSGHRHLAGTWEERAHRAEAERDLARAIAHSKALELDARVTELERALLATTTSLSWRLTAPLRLRAAR